MSHHGADDFRMGRMLLEQKVAQQASEIATLKTALRAFLDNRDEEQDVAMEAAGSSDDSDSESQSPSLPQPLWDDYDNVYRCLECQAEVVEGFCHSCSAEYDWDTENEEYSISIENEALKDDRCLRPRGVTPLLEVQPSGIPAAFYNLLERGATRLMCETFNLCFTEETGIVAWADNDIFDAFSGPGMKEGDLWKIYLGRQIQLDEDDFDGSQFLEGLLEDVLLFPMRPYGTDRAAHRDVPRTVTVSLGPQVSMTTRSYSGAWETIEERPGIWATKPMADMDSINSFVYRGYFSGTDTDEEMQNLREQQDDALEGPVDVPDTPVLHSDYYESSDAADSDNEMADGDGMETNTGYAWQANFPDRVYNLSDNDEVDSGGEGEGAEEAGEGRGQDGMETVMDEDDSADSDFDSDEVLSGDEEALLTGI